MAIDATQTFDALAEGSTLTQTAPWSINGAAPTVLAAAAKNGARGIRYSTAVAGRVQYDYGVDQTTRAVVLAMNFRINTMPAANLYFNSVLSLPTAGVVQADLRVNTALTVTMRNAGVAADTSTATLAAATWYHVEWKVQDATNTQTLRVYQGASTTPLFELTGTYTGTLTRVASFGPNTAAAGGEVDIDDVTVADDWIVAATPAGPPPEVVVNTTQTFDALVEGSTLTQTAPWSINGVAPTVLAAAAKNGARGIRYATDVAGRIQYDYGAAQTTLPIVLAMNFRINTMPSAALYMNSVVSLASGGVVQSDWRINTAMTATMRNAGVAADSSTTPLLAIATWYHAEWKVSDAADTQTLRVYQGTSTTPLFELTGAYTGTLTRVATFGPNTAALGGEVDIDDVTLAGDWIVSAVPPAPTGLSALYDFDSATADTSLTMVSPWSINGVAPTVKTASAVHGVNGVLWATDIAGRVQYDTGANQSTTPLVSSMYFRINTMPTTVPLYIMSVTSLTSAGVVQADVRVNNARTVTLRNAGLAVQTSTVLLALGTVYRAEWRLSDATDNQELRIFTGEGANPIITLAGSLTGTAIRVPTFGPNAAGAGGSLSIDTIRISDNWVGPFDPTAVQPAVYNWFRRKADGVWSPCILVRL